MNELSQLKEVLTKKEAKLVERQAWLNEVGNGRLDDVKLAEKRVQVKRDITELTFNIKDIKEIIGEEE